MELHLPGTAYFAAWCGELPSCLADFFDGSGSFKESCQSVVGDKIFRGNQFMKIGIGFHVRRQHFNFGIETFSRRFFHDLICLCGSKIRILGKKIFIQFRYHYNDSSYCRKSSVGNADK